MTDPISDMLTRIRNATLARKGEVMMPASKMKEAIARILKENNYIAGYEVVEAGAFKALRVTLNPQRDAITTITRVSKPGRRAYVGSKEIPLVLRGRGIVILSTSGGLMTGRDARRAGLGGEVICKVW